MLPPPPPINRGGEIEMTSEGARLPDRNAFEFTVRPVSRIVRGERGGSGVKSTSKDKLTGKQMLQKSLLNMKRKLNMSSTGNKFMSIVKYD
jgi:hypothetical protein